MQFKREYIQSNPLKNIILLCLHNTQLKLKKFKIIPFNLSIKES